MLVKAVAEGRLDKVGWLDSIDTAQVRLKKGVCEVLDIRSQIENASYS